GHGVRIAAAIPGRAIGGSVELSFPPLLEVASESCAAIGHGDEVYAPRPEPARITEPIRRRGEFVPTQEQLAEAIGDRLLQLMSENATSDTVLKLAEA